ncbi:MAG: hypothetical protein ACKPKO_07825, partial [Candidatus Fonsibacter sp.]
MDDITEPIITTTTAAPSSFPSNDYNFYASNISKVWSIINVQTKCDIVSLDNSVEEEFYKGILSGQPFYKSIIIHSFVKCNQLCPLYILINAPRSLTRIKSVFVSLYRIITDQANHTGSKKRNDFYSPMWTNMNY